MTRRVKDKVDTSLRVLVFNAQSIRNKMDLFKSLMAVEKPDIVGITESWIHTNTRDFEGEFEISGYRMFKKDRIGKEGGGVLIYIRDYLDPIDCKLETDHEIAGVYLNKLDKRLHIFIVYRPPHQCSEKDESLYSSLRNIISNKLCIVAGDFNCTVNWQVGSADNEGKRLLDFASEEYLTQWVDKPTRGNNVLDLVFSSEDNMISNVCVGEKLGKSDHYMVRFEIEASFSRSERLFAKPNFKRANFRRMRSEVEEIAVSEEIEVEGKWQSFKTKYIKAQSNCIPQMKINTSRTDQPKWFNRDIGKAIRDRQKAYKLSKEQPNEATTKVHIQKCREVSKLIRKTKLEYEDRIAAVVKENPKAFFAHVNSRKPVKSTLGPLKDQNERIISSDEGMASILNEYFCTVYTEEDTSTIPRAPITYQGNEPLDYINITEDIIISKIRKLKSNKSPGPDGFHPRVIKETAEGCAPHFCSIFKTSLEQRKAVSDWKLQNITPIFKKGSKNEPGNYRPISLTSVPGKMLESIIAERITAHLEANNLILDSQHGFRNGRSCLTNLLEFFHHMFSAFDKSRAVDIIYLDFKKAFDKVPHKRLMKKVRSLGIVGEVGDWIEDWLSERKQRVVINGASSGWRDVTSGVPQGSVLGPLLFIIYINDMDVSLISKISKFADDTKVGINADNKSIKQLQEDLRTIGEWSQKWQMPFNSEKCKVMHIGYRNTNAEYSLLGKRIDCCNEEKDLGVIISRDLQFTKQCTEVEKKAQKLLGYIKRQFITRRKETILTLYNALVRPHLEYAAQFWSPSQRKDIEKLEAVQARATKLIPSIRHLGYQRRLERLNLYSLEKRRLRGQLIETYKILSGIDKIDHRNLFTLSNNQTRTNGWKLELKRFNTSHCGTFFTYKIPSFWNRLPADVVNSSTVNQFKVRLDRVIDSFL